METSWRDLKLSLERPYKNDNGEPILNLLDITQQGEFIYETKDPPSKALGEKLGRIFIERGFDFFDKIQENPNSYYGELPQPRDEPSEAQNQDAEDEEEEPSSKFMSAEELAKMRMELAQELVIAQGEMEVGKVLLETIQSSTSSGQPSQPIIPGIPSSIPTATPDAKPPPKLAATIVTKPPPIQSIQAFNAQLVISSKDEALRAAADVFKSAADSMERSRQKGENYWVDALKIRRANWGLVPAPLPFGSPTGKGADKTSRDFLITFGLEESAPIFKRRAMGHIPPMSTKVSDESIIYPQLNHQRLCVSLSFTDATTGEKISAQNVLLESNTSTPDASLRSAQQEVVEQEIFSFLVKEASNLPTATARVSERLIVLDAAHGLSLKFELVNLDLIPVIRRKYAAMDPSVIGKCDLIFYALHVLLIRAHGHSKRQRLGNAGVFLPNNPQANHPTPTLLQPILDMLQYEAFCLRLKAEVDGAIAALTSAGVGTTFRFDPVGDVGVNLLKFLQDEQHRKLGGEMVLRIEDKHTLRMTMTSPAAMTVHLAQASISIHTIPQFGQLLADELEHCLLLRICELGKQLCESVNGTWFVDFSRCIGKWEGCALNFQVTYRNAAFSCSSTRIDRAHKMGAKETYTPQRGTLLGWVETLITEALNSPS